MKALIPLTFLALQASGTVAQRQLQSEISMTSRLTKSLRPLHRGLVIEPGARCHALACILPYEEDGFKMYYAEDTSGKDVGSRSNEFGISTLSDLRDEFLLI